LTSATGLVIAGRIRPLDKLTHRVLLDWPGYRRTRWPNTANPHLIINQQTAPETRSVSTLGSTAKTALRGHTATLERLRVDRQLEEALTYGPDPLRLAAVFGLDAKTTIRYAESARQLLETQAEQHIAESSPRTQGSNCGVVKAKLRLAERVFTCSSCGMSMDRDLNAARTLARDSLSRSAAARPPRVAGRR
jgi:Putative transposase DNA-binding domain